jgi:hypothetical protein
MPAGLPPGTYYLIAKADGDNTVAESAESNNTGARALQVAASPAAVLAVRENVTSLRANISTLLANTALFSTLLAGFRPI